jgi:hypothetical protein
MNVYAHIAAATAEDFRSCLLEHPLARALRRGELQLGHYRAYLRETYHLVRHTPPIYRLAAARSAEPALRRWFLAQADDEEGHHLLCVKDLRRLGARAEQVLDGSAGAGVCSLLSLDYYFAACGDPRALLGSCSLSEELGATLAEPAMQALRAALRLPRAALSFIRAHGGQDRRHFEDAQQALQRWVDASGLDTVIRARRMAIERCGRVLSDVYGCAER